MDFSLPLEAHGDTHSAQHRHREQHAEQSHASSSLSTALIIHPLSLFSSTLSPTYGQEMFLSKLTLQMHEMQQLYEQQQLAQQQQLEVVAAEKKSLLDYTCDENIKSILGYLDGASLSAAQRVSQYFYQVSGDDAYWYNLCRAEWAISPEQLKTRPASYQALYKYACKSLKRLIRDFFEEQCLTSMQQSFRIPRDTALMIARRAR